MRLPRVVAAFALLVALLGPEISRYRAERELRRLTSIAIAASSGRVSASSAQALLRESSARLAELARAMPGDTRPRMFAAGASLGASDTDRAIALYLAAFGCGERGEIDLNLGRAWAKAGDARAEAMFERAVWISPRLLSSVPSAFRDRIRDRIAARTARSDVTDPPPLPVLPSSAAVLD